MAKQGMKRPNENISTESNKKNPSNTIQPVPEIQGKAKNSNKDAGSIH